MEVKKLDDEIYEIIDEELSINATYDNGYLNGKGSRKYKKNIMSTLDNYKVKESVLDDAISELEFASGKSQEVFALGSTITAWSDNSSYDVDDIEKIYKWQAEPVRYNENLRDLSLKWYSQKGVLSEVYDLYKTLPTLDGSIECDNKKYEGYEDDLTRIKRFDSSVKKSQIREMLLDTAINGTLITYRRGTVKNPYIQILDLDYYYPARIKGGRWEVECDLMQFADGTAQNNAFNNQPINMSVSDFEKITAKPELDSQPPEVREAFERWRNGKGSVTGTYVLSMSKTGVVFNKSRQRERYGRPVGIAAFEDLLHKDLLKLAERAVVDKVIETLLVVKLGEEGKEGYHPTEKQAKKVYDSIKKVLNSETSEAGNKLVGVPYWAEIESLKVDLGIFDNDKYAQVDQDILVSLGVSGILNIGQGNNYSSGKINENIFYSKVFDILEQIQDEVYNVQFKQIVSNADRVFTKSFNRTVTVDNSDKLEILQSLLDKGGAIKPVLDEVGVDFEEYMKQVKYETEEVGTHDLLVPYLTSYTTTEDDGGRPTGDSPEENEGGNNQQKPSTE